MADETAYNGLSTEFDLKPAATTAGSDGSSMYYASYPGSAGAPPPFATYDGGHALPMPIPGFAAHHDHQEPIAEESAVKPEPDVDVPQPVYEPPTEEQPKPEIAPEADFAVAPADDSQTPNAAAAAAARVEEVPEEPEPEELEDDYEVEDREDADADWVPDGDNDDEPAAPRRTTSRRSTGGRAAAAPAAPTAAQVQAQQQHMLQQAQAQYYLQQQAAQQAAHAAALAHAQEQGLPPPEAPAQMLDPETLAALQRQLQQQPGGNIPVGPEIVGVASSAGTPSRKRRIDPETDELQQLDDFIDDEEGEGGKKKKARKSGVPGAPRVSNPNPVMCDFVDETGKVCNTPFQRPYDLARHRETKHGSRDPRPETICDRCHKAFSRKDALLRHKRQNKCTAEKGSTPRRRHDTAAQAAAVAAAASTPESPAPASSIGVNDAQIHSAAMSALNYGSHAQPSPQQLGPPQIAVDPSVDPSVANQGGSSGNIDVISYMQQAPQLQQRSQAPADPAFAAAAAAAAAHASAHAHHIGGQHDLGGLNGYPSQQ